MKIAGFVKQSLVDYPGKIAAVIFTQGCNMNCVFCHNRCLVRQRTDSPLLEEGGLLSFLEKRKKFLDGVVVSGGEPTLQKDLKEFIRKIKDLGYPVKLDTNGTRPEVIKELLEKNLLDYVAMDVKAPMKKYREICRTDVDKYSIMESISMLISSDIAYEFRTTCCPQLSQTDIQEIGGMVHGAQKYVLQQYRESDEVYGGYTRKAITLQLQDKSIRELRNYVSSFQVRGEYEIHAF